MNNSVEMLCNHKKVIKSCCKNEESNRKRIKVMEKFLDELHQHFAEEEYQHENNVIH